MTRIRMRGENIVAGCFRRVLRLDLEFATHMLYGVKFENDPERFKKLKAEVERDTSAWGLAELYETQNVIDPRDTRAVSDTHAGNTPHAFEERRGEHLLRNWPTSY